MFLGAILVVGFLAYSHTADANPQSFYQSFLNGNSATTSVVYMTPGTATSTLYWDASVGGASNTGSESGAVAIFLNASSTGSTLVINQEYAEGPGGVNCTTSPTSCDWYQSTQTVFNGYATTTIPTTGYDMGVVPQFSWKFASSSTGGGAILATNNSDSRVISVQTPTKYVRFIFSLKPGGTNASVWAAMVAKKQNN